MSHRCGNCESLIPLADPADSYIEVLRVIRDDPNASESEVMAKALKRLAGHGNPTQMLQFLRRYRDGI